MFNRRKKHAQFILCAIFIILLLLSPFKLTGWSGVALAQESEYDGLDIVFLVDQSGSMARLNGGGEPNDPLGLRFYSLWYGMYWLGEDNLLIHNDSTFRMAVINFGSTAESWKFNDDTRNPYWVEISPSSREEWEPLRAELDETIQSDMQGDFSKRDLRNTNFLTAFQKADGLFNDLPASSGNNLRVIVVLTDGAPNAEGVTMSDVLEYTRNNFPEPNYRIYLVGMVDAEDPYWDNVRYYWEQITADPCTDIACPDPATDRSSLVANDDEVGKRFQEILGDLTKNIPRPSGVLSVDSDVIPGPVVIPPYLKSVIFTYFKASTEERLILTDPTGAKMDETNSGVKVEGADGPIEAVHVINPMPGEWSVATDPTGIDVNITMRQIFAQSRLESPSGSQVQYIPLTIRYALLDDLGQPLPAYDDPRYRLIVQATVNASGQSWPLVLSSAPGNLYEASFTPEITGTHSISVMATSQDLNGNPVIVFDGAIGTFEVGSAFLRPVDLPVTWLQHEKRELVFELQDERGFPVNAPSPLEILVTISGEKNEPFNLVSLPDGTYQGQYTPRQSGTHTIHVTASMRDNTGKLKVITDADAGTFEVVPTILVNMKALEPSQVQQYNTGIWPFERLPLVLEIQLSDDNGNPLSADRIFTNPDQPLRTIVKKDGQEIPNIHLLLEETNQPGLYRAETTELGLGNYEIEVTGSGLYSGYVYFNSSSPQITVLIERVLYPLHLPILIGVLILLLVTATSTTAAVIRNRRLKQHPCKGLIYIVDSYGVPKFQARLDSYGKNRVIFTSRDINPLTHIRRLEVICKSPEESKRSEVYVTFWLDKDRNPALFQHSLRQGGEIRVGKYAFWILKDPDEDQLSHDRSEDSES